MTVLKILAVSNYHCFYNNVTVAIIINNDVMNNDLVDKPALFFLTCKSLLFPLFKKNKIP